MLKMSNTCISETFLYFGFGSNLLHERLTLMNPSAVFRDTAMLKNHRLSFNFGVEPKDRSKLGWCGCPATVEPVDGQVVWGVVWEMSKKDLPNLDRQEGVILGIYQPIEVVVETASKESLTCRAYKLLLKGDGDNRPSPQYLDVILRGAKQNNLPTDYVDHLQTIEHNNYSGNVEVYESTLKMIEEKKAKNPK